MLASHNAHPWLRRHQSRPLWVHRHLYRRLHRVIYRPDLPLDPLVRLRVRRQDRWLDRLRNRRKGRAHR